MTPYPALVATSLLMGLAIGCTALLDFPEEVTGYRWCLDAEPATGRRFDNQNLIGITYPVSNNWTRACTCSCAADHQIILQGAAGALTPGSEDALWYESAYFAEECTQYDDNCPPGAPGGFGTDGYIPGESTTAGTSPSDTGIDSSGGSDTSDTSDCPTRDHCDIEAAFVRALLTDPRLLPHDHVRLAAGTSALGHRGLHLLELAPDSLPAALGLRAAHAHRPAASIRAARSSHEADRRHRSRAVDGHADLPARRAARSAVGLATAV